MLVCFDATVLCGALRKPTGLNFRLLELAADGVVLDGFTTEVAGMEFVRNALDGLAGIAFAIDEIGSSWTASARSSTLATSRRRRSAAP